MSEKVFNLFYFVDDSVITEIGVVVHQLESNDDESIKFLQTTVQEDYKKCARYSLPKNLHSISSKGTINHSSYSALSRLGQQGELFEEILIKYKASKSPLCLVTPIVNGRPRIDVVAHHQEYPRTGPVTTKDYLKEYMTPHGFDLPTLIHNDYFKAIKLLFNQGHYVSCMKLLASFIDTMAYLEYGDVRGNFLLWLDSYSDLGKIGITSSQLWELRNSILHMSNLDSRKVLSQVEKRISFSVSKSGYSSAPNDETQYFNLMDFIDVIAQSLSAWFMSYNDEPNKFAVFVERYDRIVSDERYSKSNITTGKSPNQSLNPTA